jgi:hypothetical protein
VGAGRRFSIISAGLGCEVKMDAWVGICRWGTLNITEIKKNLYSFNIIRYQFPNLMTIIVNLINEFKELRRYDINK